MAFGFKRKQQQPNPRPKFTPDAAQRLDFIPNAGACLVTTHVRDGVGRVRFMHRDESRDPVDNGWRIFSEFDTEEYMADGNPFVIMDFNQACAIEPALIGIYHLPVGSDLAIERDEAGIHIIDTVADREIPREEQFNPWG